MVYHKVALNFVNTLLSSALTFCAIDKMFQKSFIFGNYCLKEELWSSEQITYSFKETTFGSLKSLTSFYIPQCKIKISQKKKHAF